ALYTADIVLGHETTMFEDLAAYIASLSNILQYKASVNSEYDILYSGHGTIFTNGQETIATYTKHRLEREAQIMEVLRLPVLSNSSWRRRTRMDDNE
ncbi:hypothetical protein BYT27DRAFT_7088426, partial [Phlegmacium glaucopus]